MTAKRLLVGVTLCCLALLGALPAAAADDAAPQASTPAVAGPGCPAQATAWLAALAGPAGLAASARCGDCPGAYDTLPPCDGQPAGASCGIGKTCKVQFVYCHLEWVTDLYCKCA